MPRRQCSASKKFEEIRKLLRTSLPYLLPLAGLMIVGAPLMAGGPPRISGARPSSSPVPVSFREEIEPLVRAECVSCHGKDTPSGGLNLASPEAMRKGGTTTGARLIVPGNPKASLLVAYIQGSKQPRMPLGRPALSEEKIRRVEEWIQQGAIVDPIKLTWPYTPPAAFIPVPKVRDAAWPRNDIDRFVLAKLEARGLQPSPPASKAVLLRRVYLDLVGLPPAPEEADRFYADSTPGAYERLVDRLLDDPRYGERWARHWLDLVRFAETHGFEQDNIRPRAWRYRDYVIRSFNVDKPYDRFLKEQLAGDELYPNDPDALIATGFARLGSWDELSKDGPQRWQDYLNDATDTTGSVMLGLTVGCARCHDHKYDRITQRDYYRLQSFFVSTQWRDLKLPDAAQPAAYQERVAAARTKIEALSAEAKATTDEKRRDQLNGDAGRLERDIAPIEPYAEGITDGGPIPVAHHVLLRGSLTTPGPEVAPGFIASLCGGVERPALPAPVDGETTGERAALALWIASPNNPLTARVIVNRLWQHHFGQGIVATPSDFGKNGGNPSHPELLDYLARQFVADGWSLKKMHRRMLLSATYRQSIAENPRAAKADPANRLLWRMNRIRLEGEALRDSILAVSGRLNPERGGPSVYPAVSAEVLDTGSTHKWGSSPEDQRRRRTIYVFQRRSLALPLVEAFDGPDMVNTCPRRSTTTIAPQALALFNGAFSREESRCFADRVEREVGANPTARIALAYRLAFCRAPSPNEKARARAYLDRKAAMYASTAKSDAEARSRAFSDLCHVLINANEFLYLD
jgi:hypothetical protein